MGWRLFKKPIADKLVRGIYAGVIAGLLKDIPALIFELLFKNPHPTFWDYMSLLAIGRLPRSWDEYVMAIIVQVLWCTLLAVAFVYLHPKLQSKHYIIQGAGFGILIWLVIRGLVYFFRTPDLIHDSPLTAMMNVNISIFYGIIVAIVDKKLADK